MKVRGRPIVTDLMWWVIETPIRRRVALYGSILVAPFILAALSGSSMDTAFEIAAVPAVSFTIYGLLMFALRRADLI